MVSRANEPRPSGVAERIRRAVPTLQAHLMWPELLGPFDEEALIETDSTLGLRIDFHHPAVEPFRIQLLVDCAVERVREVDVPAIAADLSAYRPVLLDGRHVPQCRRSGPNR